MSNAKQHLSEPKTEHLSLEQMQEYLEETLPDTRMHQIERHLLDCELCSDALEGLSAAPQDHNPADAVTHLKQKIRKKSLRNPIIRRKRKIVPLLWKPLSIAAAILILLSGTFLIFKINKRMLHPSEEISLASKNAPQTTAPSVITKPEVATSTQALPKAAQEALTLRNRAKKSSSDPRVAGNTVMDKSLTEEMADEEVFSEKIAMHEAVPAPPVAAAPEPANEEEAVKKDISLIPAITQPDANKTVMNGASKSRNLSTREASGITQSFTTITGKVVASDDEMPLPGVSITVKGRTNGTVTDEFGKFKLLAPMEGTLVFNYIGMQTEEVTIKNQSKIDVHLRPDAQVLSEVVVTDAATEESEEKAYTYKKPDPTNGFPEFKRYVRQKLNYPQEAKRKNIEGIVKVEFVVNPDGQLSDFRIKKSVGYGCDEEAIRLIKEGPAWKPILQNNQPVKHKFNVSVPFKL